MKSMLSAGTGSHSSHDYIGDERRKAIADEVAKIDPFSKKRPQIEFYDKSRGSPFSGLNMVKVDKFVQRNKKNFKRNFNEKLV